MSHFTLMVKVKKNRLESHHGDVEAAVLEMLLPFQESAKEEYMTFVDCTDKIESCLKEIIKDNDIIGENPDAAGKTIEEFYGGFDNVAVKYHRFKKHPVTGKFGYWVNLNAKWDWYKIGGRWSCLLPVKKTPEGQNPGGFGTRSWSNENKSYPNETADYCKIKYIDFDKIKENVNKSIEEFWKCYNDWISIKDISYEELMTIYGSCPETEETHYWRDLFYWFHSRLMKIGVGKCVKPRELLINPDGTPMMEIDVINSTKEKTNYIQMWSKPVFEYIPITKNDLYLNYYWHFQFNTFAVLDDTGWKEKGKMGWWGISSESIEEEKEWNSSYFDNFIANEDPDTTLVVVDCHI